MTNELTPDERKALEALRDECRTLERAIREAPSAEARAEALERVRTAISKLRDADRPGRPITADRAALRAKARDMRAGGHSYSAISKALGIARSTIQRWVEDIQKGES